MGMKSGLQIALHLKEINHKKKLPINQELTCGAPTEIRTPVLALKGLRPSPLDDGGKPRDFTTLNNLGQVE